jgi:hypothetical protein
MSYTIVYQIEAFTFPKAAEYDHDLLLIIWEAGANNCYDAGNQRRARSWQAQAIGMPYQVIREICEYAGECEGGGLTLSGRTQTTPEAFITRHRKAIKDAAVGLEALAEKFSLDAYLLLKPGRDDKKIADASKIRTGKPSNDEWLRFDFDLSDPEQFRFWASRASHPLFCSADVKRRRQLEYAY